MGSKITTIILLFFGNFAQATYVFTPSVTTLQQTQNDQNAVESKSKLTVLDFRLGYVLESGVYLGGLYSIQDQQLFQGGSDSYLGPSVGYYNGGFLVAATYYLYGERDLTSGGGKFAKVKGYQIDISYALPVTESFLMGPQLTYHDVSFDELQINGVGQVVSFKRSGISPLFNMTFLF